MRVFEGFQRGVNLGGWLSQADRPEKQHYDTFITEQDIKDIAALKVDHVRLPVDYTLIETADGEMIEEGYSYIDHAIQWTRNAGLNLLLDMHNTYGYTFDPLEKRKARKRSSLRKRFRNGSTPCGTASRNAMNPAVTPLRLNC